MNKPLLDIRQTILINAPLDKVWTVLTEPEYVNQWLGCLRYEKSLDHVFYMQQDAAKREADDIEGATHCRVLTLEKPHKFVFSWYIPGTPETEVHIGLQASNGATQVTLTHIGWDQFDSEAIRAIRDGLEGGWKSFVLPQLKHVAEQGSDGQSIK